MATKRKTISRKLPQLSRPTTRNYVRTTIVLPVALDQNLEILCAQEGKTKNKAVIEALDVMIRKAGLQPFKQPKKVAFTVKY